MRWILGGFLCLIRLGESFLSFIPPRRETIALGNKYSSTRRLATLPEKDVDDVKLLKSVKRQELVNLCQKMNLSTKGNKEELLRRLREHVEAQRTEAAARRRERIRKVEEGPDDPKERYEIINSPLDKELNDDYDDDDDDSFLFYYAPDAFPPEATEQTEAKPKKASYVSQAAVTAPPPPVEPNENGERVVKVYSTTEENDLTGIAASQPGLSATSTDALTNAPATSTASQPWDPQNNQRATSSQEEQKAMEEITELVQVLLSMTGLPAFNFGEDSVDNVQSSVSPQSYAGFDPSKVPTDLLPSFSQSLRTGRGAILQDVLRQFEMQAIGQDGMHGDYVENGGGHYREVAKVRAFLEGYRRAEVRRIARETTSLLLDKLVLEGVEGLDMTLATMTRSNDDTSNQGGELNDSLLDYLNDAIRQQEKKVDKLVAARLEASEEGVPNGETFAENALDKLWNVTTTDDGGRLESLDPKNPLVKEALEEELAKEEISFALANERRELPDSAPEKLLLLLSLLRDRVKAEAAFVPDEKGRNLRLLAYCLQLTSEVERRQLMSKELGTSIDVRVFFYNRKKDANSTLSSLAHIDMNCTILFLSVLIPL